MYTQFFKLTHSPFSIAPDPRFLFMSERHREALAHLLYGVNGGGGFVLLTGEIGAGKTTVCRCFLEQIPKNCNVGYIFNPKLTVNELLQSICDEFHISYRGDDSDPASIKEYVDALNAFLLQAHAAGRHNVLIIDEAQSLSAAVLEQLRLLTNLETNERKLLQIILIGQPELRSVLARPELSQLAQRIIARYHLDSLSFAETAAYVVHRLAVAGITTASPLPQGLMKTIHRLTQGIPRRINLLCDRALLGAYAEGKPTVNRRILGKAAHEVFDSTRKSILQPVKPWRYAALGTLGGATLAAAVVLAIGLFSGTATRAALHTSIDTSHKPSAFAMPAAIAATTASPASVLPSTHSAFNVDDAPDADAVDAERAYRHLARLWGQTLADGEPCQAAQQINLRCYQSNKGFAEIRQLDRPVILSLRNQADHVYYALLTGLTDTQATLMIGDDANTVNLTALAHHFHGDFVTFWRAPSGYREKIHRDDQGKDVDWIAFQLRKLNGVQTPAGKHGEQPFDLAMARQIRDFQSAQGLEADGVVGPKTFMQLSHAIDNTEPRLHGSLSAMQESPRK